MRKNSIISELRKKGRVRRLRSHRIKYSDALQKLKAFQNNKLIMIGMVDNNLSPNKSISNRCQVDTCKKRIRYEYKLMHKDTKDLIIVGSTCVGHMLDLSVSDVKDFTKVDKSIKDFHAMLKWKNDNKDVYDKTKTLEKLDIKWFTPFWEEIKYCPLHPDDTVYIQGIDMDKEIDRNNLRGKSKVVTVTSSVKTINNTAVVNEHYGRILSYLEELFIKYPKDSALASMRIQVNVGKVLTDNQQYTIKCLVNQDYFKTKIKGTPQEVLYNSCDKDIVRFFQEKVSDKSVKIYFLDVDDLYTIKVSALINKYKKQFDSLLLNTPKLKTLWKYYRIKHNIILN